MYRTTTYGEDRSATLSDVARTHALRRRSQTEIRLLAILAVSVWILFRVACGEDVVLELATLWMMVFAPGVASMLPIHDKPATLDDWSD